MAAVYMQGNGAINVTWTSSDPSAASVDSEGKVTSFFRNLGGKYE